MIAALLRWGDMVICFFLNACLTCFLSLDELVKPFKKPTMEGKSLVFAMAVDLIEFFSLVTLLSLLLQLSENRLCIKLYEL